jgi:cytochrome c-type biogenesis protein CcmH
MKSSRFSLALGLTLFLLAVSAAAVLAQTKPQPSDDDVNAVAHELYCPVCENIPLDVCPTQACAQWRDLIREKLSEGWTKEQIKQYFQRQYGDRVLAEPPREGLNWMVYILPPAFILVGAYLVFRVISKRKPVGQSAVGSASAGASVSDDPYLKRLEDELKKRK